MLVGSEGCLFHNLQAMQAELLSKEPSDFVSHYLFDRVPFVFGGDLGAWIAWKTKLAKQIDVDPRDVVLTGSAAIGFSLSPDKNFSAFHEGSDIDVGVVSAFHFDMAWRHLRQQRTAWLTIGGKTKGAIEAHRKNYVFAGTIATDKMLGILPFGLTWQQALDQMALVEPTLGRDVKLRIYRDYDALRYYQASNIRNLQALVASPAQDEEEIKEEN